MLRLIKLCTGAFAILIGALGTVFGIGAVVGSWTLADRLSREVPASIADLEQVVDLVRQQGDASLTLIDTVRDRVRFVGETVEELAGVAQRDPEAPTLLEALDPDIEQRLEAAETFILALQDSLRSLNRALVLLDSVPFFPRRSVSERSADAPPLQNVASSLNEATTLLDEASRTLTRIRMGQALSLRQRAQFQELLAEVDFALSDVRNQIDTFFTSLDQASDRLGRVREGASVWIDRAAGVSTVFFVCFAASQFSLMLHGGALVSRAARVRSIGAEPRALDFEPNPSENSPSSDH
ncbi:hypothetical protein [Tautonia rosea]|uniref:hypothetical protein n=1 Tax=Tautonia rosea TaxID=2728037 RepID=UPI0014753241|nr:hypothetical protein [Tautonia rosea]